MSQSMYLATVQKLVLTFNFVEDDAGVFWVKFAKIWLSRLFAEPAVNAWQVATLGWPLYPMVLPMS